MKLCDYRSFEIHVPMSGGKAGKGCNRTSSIQVRRHNSIQIQFRFVLADPASRSGAIAKARAYCNLQFLRQGLDRSTP